MAKMWSFQSITGVRVLGLTRASEIILPVMLLQSGVTMDVIAFYSAVSVDHAAV